MAELDGNLDLVAFTDRLKALHADSKLFDHMKFFIHDLLVFGKDEGARLRLLQDPTAQFYMSSVYFTTEQAEFLLSFKGRDGRTLEETLQSRIARKVQQARDGSTSSYEICTSHDLAPVFQDHFDVEKGFHDKNLYNKFAKEHRKQQQTKSKVRK